MITTFVVCQVMGNGRLASIAGWEFACRRAVDLGALFFAPKKKTPAFGNWGHGMGTGATGTTTWSMVGHGRDTGRPAPLP